MNNKVKNKVIPKKRKSTAKRNVQTNTKPDLSYDMFTFDFRDYRWLIGVKVDKFTNKLKDVYTYSEYITLILAKIIPEVQEKSKDIQRSLATGFHCHPIQQDDDAYRTITKIIRTIYGESFEKKIDINEQIYQIGVVGKIRIIALRNKKTNVIRPLFIDYHHLAYPDVKYNQTDYLKQEFCPISQYISR